jgi:hypothetical protein
MKKETFLNILDKPFPYLDKIYLRLIHVITILIYSVFIMEVFQPFNFNLWLRTEGIISSVGLGLATFGIIGSLIVALSQLVIRTLIKINQFKLKHFILWVLGELILISIMLTLAIRDPRFSFFEEIKTTLGYTSLVLILPYSFSIVITAFIYHMREKTVKSKFSAEQMDLISFKDERDQVKFSVKRKDILYLESTDNYITVYFLNDKVVSKHMVRTSLKKLEDLNISDFLVRCHRSFMVNLENVLWMKKEGRNFVLKIKQLDSLIPVSRSYVPHFKSLIQS